MEQAWTEVNDLNTARKLLEMGLWNSNAAALAFGGVPDLTNSTNRILEWNSWTEVNDLNSARRGW
jgi:hypothetical protein